MERPRAKIKNCPLFLHLSEGELDAIERISVVRRFSRGEMVFSEGDPAEGFFIVASGRVKIFKLSPEGREQIIRIAPPGETFAEAAMFSGERYPAYAQALTDCELLYLPKMAFVKIIEADPQLSLKMLGTLSHLLRGLNNLIEDLSLKEVPARVAKYLLDLSAKRGANSFELDLKKSDLALRIGTVSETLSRTLGRLRDGGIIDIDGGRITILDREVLQKISAGLKL